MTEVSWVPGDILKDGVPWEWESSNLLVDNIVVTAFGIAGEEQNGPTAVTDLVLKPDSMGNIVFNTDDGTINGVGSGESDNPIFTTL